MMTQLLLIEDVEDLGRSGDVVKVKPGYARNFLLPKGSALIADKNTLRMQERLKEERLKKAAEDQKIAVELAKKFEGKTFETTVKVDQEGHMYGSVSAIDIIKIVEADMDISLSKKMVQLKHPIKQIGVHTIEIKLQEGVPASFTLKVMSEAGELEIPKKEVEEEVAEPETPEEEAPQPEE